MTDYFNKWVEVITVKNANGIDVMRFLEQKIVAMFGCPRKIITDNGRKMITDNGKDFSSTTMII